MRVESPESASGECPNSPKVSVCVMTYNQEKFIRQCLKSIVEQKANFEFEVIVGDDCSSDGTKEIVREIVAGHPNVKYIRHEHNIGVEENYRSIHAAANGEYVAHCDGDDLWLPGKLQRQVDLLDREQDASQCWGCAHLIDDDGNVIGLFPSRLAKWLYPTRITPRHIALSYALVGQHSTQMYRNERKFAFNPSEATLDFRIAFHMALSGPAIYEKHVVGGYRVTWSPSVTRGPGRKRVTVDVLALHLLEIIRNHKEFAREAKANLVVRRWVSKVRGHDVTEIDTVLAQVKDVRFSLLLGVRSLYYFMLQKIF